MRSITVDGVCADLKACIAVTIDAGSRPMSRGIVVFTEGDVAWQPEQERAPGGASAGPAANAEPINPKLNEAVTMMRIALMLEHPSNKVAANIIACYQAFLKS
jgi:hypothetical protein